MSRKTAAIVLSAVAAVALSACSTTTGSAGAEQTGSNRPSSSSSSSSSAAAQPAAEETTESSQDSTLKFGQTYTWTDGLSVTVSKPTKFKPSEYAAAEKANAYLSFTITIVNKTGKTFDPALFNATVQSANAEADSVFDSAKGYNGAPSTKLLNGREAKFKLGFGVSNAKDIVMELNPGAFDYEPAMFTS